MEETKKGRKEGRKAIRRDRRINGRKEGYKDVNMEIMMYKKRRKQRRAKEKLNRTREERIEGVKLTREEQTVTRTSSNATTSGWLQFRAR
jgi:hypothetical protein